jgi:hypothetical protein
LTQGTHIEALNLLLYINYADGSKAVIPVIDEMCSGYNMKVTTPQRVTISYCNYNASFKVNTIKEIRNSSRMSYEKLFDEDEQGLDFGSITHWVTLGEAMRGSTRSENSFAIRGQVLNSLGGRPFHHNTVRGKTIQTRLYILNPGVIMKDIFLSAYTMGEDVDLMRTNIENWYNIDSRVIHFEQEGRWPQVMHIAVRLDFEGFDTRTLMFYTYDKVGNIITKLKEPKYYFDDKGFLHFWTHYAGDIIVTDRMIF